jgi:glutamine synthetase
MCKYTVPKNIKLFEEMKVLTKEECEARQTVMLNHYIGTVEIEVQAMTDMINQYIIPAVKTANVGPLVQLEVAVSDLKRALEHIHHEEDLVKKVRIK